MFDFELETLPEYICEFFESLKDMFTETNPQPPQQLDLDEFYKNHSF